MRTRSYADVRTRRAAEAGDVAGSAVEGRTCAHARMLTCTRGATEAADVAGPAVEGRTCAHARMLTCAHGGLLRQQTWQALLWKVGHAHTLAC